MKNVRSFFNPENLLNPGKIFPQPGKCAESKSNSILKGGKKVDKPKLIASKSGISV